MELNMANHQNKITVLFFSLFFLTLGERAFSENIISNDSIISSFNTNSLYFNKENEAHSFIVGGHLYGDNVNQLGTYPASSLIANIDRINAVNPDFFISLGDNIRESNNLQLNNFYNSFTSKLNFPFFTVLGNHDVYGTPKLFLELLQNRYYSFIYKCSSYIFLDAITNNGRIEGEQLSWLNKQIKIIRRSSDIKNIFVFSHKPIWYDQIKEMGAFDDRYYHKFNFSKDIMPQMLDLNKEIYLISDDFGGTVNGLQANIFYHHDSKNNIFYISTGIGDNLYDMLVKIDIGADKNVIVNEFSLTETNPIPIKNFDINYFKELKPYRTQWQKIKSRVYNQHIQLGFVIGILFTVILIFLGFLIVKKRY
jgi:hypothetical protein